MSDLLLPDQLQLLLESPEDGDVPTLLYGLVRDCIQTGLAWELERTKSVALADGRARRGEVWPPGLGDVDALAATLLTPDHLANGMGAAMFVRQLGPEKGLITAFFGQRLADRHLLDTKQERQFLFLSKVTHPVSAAGQQEIAALQADVRSSLSQLAAGPVDASSRAPRAWMLAVLLDTFFLLTRALPDHPAKGRTASPAALQSLVSAGVMSAPFAKLAGEVANTSDRPESWFDVVSGLIPD